MDNVYLNYGKKYNNLFFGGSGTMNYQSNRRHVKSFKTNDPLYSRTHGKKLDINKRKNMFKYGDNYKFSFVKWDPNTIIDPKSFLQHHIKLVFNRIKNKDEILQPHIIWNQIPGSLEYTNKKDLSNELYGRMIIVCHNGQRKLMLSEIQHLTHHLDSKNEEAIVFYAGSAPGNKAYIISQLFPKVKFIFIDPNEVRIYVNGQHDDHYNYADEGIFVYMNVLETNNTYDVKGERFVKHFKEGIVNKNTLIKELDWEEDEMIDFIVNTDYRFYIFEEFMTPELAGSFRKLIEHFKDKKILFWSDIRTNYRDTEDNLSEEILHVSDTDVIANTAMTYNWLKIMTKDYDGISFNSMLKMRVPYLEDKSIEWDVFGNQFEIAKKLGVDYRKLIEESIENKKPILPWFKGTIYMQAWAASKSAENRLWSNLKELQSDLEHWDTIKYEQKCFYYNVIERFTRSFENNSATKTTGMDHCGDCAIEATIWNEYKNKLDPKFNVDEMVLKINDFTGRSLKRYPHGFNFPK